MSSRFVQLNSKKALITGGLGFIGSNLAHRLVGLGVEVTLVDSLIPEYGGNLCNIEPFKDCVRVNISDIRDEHAMKYLVQGQDYLFNLCGKTSHVGIVPASALLAECAPDAMASHWRDECCFVEDCRQMALPESRDA